MSLLPNDAEFGALELDEVFLDYEGPKLFSARNATGQRYVAVAVEEVDDGLLFLYVPVSAERYLAVRSGVIPLRQALTEPEGNVYLVHSRFEAGTHEVSVQGAGTIPDDWLPEADAVIGLPTHTQHEFDPGELCKRANAEVRSLVALRLDRPDLMRTEYPLRDLKDLLDDVQEAVHAMAAEAEDKATAAGSIPEQIVRASELSLIDLQAASFVVVLAPTLGDELWEHSLATTATDRLLALVASTQNEQDLRVAIAGLKQRAFSKFRRLLQDLADTTASLKMYVANPGAELRETSLTAQQANTGLAVLSEISTTTKQVYVESGVLIGANVRTRAFELRDDESGDKYAGKVDADALSQIDGLQIGEAFRYSARISVEENFISALGDSKETHRLQMIKRASAQPEPADGVHADE